MKRMKDKRKEKCQPKKTKAYKQGHAERNTQSPGLKKEPAGSETLGK